MGCLLSVSPTVDELRRACSRAGGQSYIDGNGGGYGCKTENCDGNGGTCDVHCDNKNQCFGHTPRPLPDGVTLIGILQNGNMVVYDDAPRSNQSLSESQSGSAPVEGSAPPLVIY